MSTTLSLLKFKAESGISDVHFTKLLGLIGDFLPEDNVLPTGTNEAKKVVCPLGLEIQNMHTCMNDCILYRSDYKVLRNYPTCNAPRYKRKIAKDKNKPDDEINRGIPFKVVWYLPLVPRLKRLFANPKEAQRLRWHEEERKKINI